jgi:RimJ/RimL family protein N-acetyltransferase
MIYGKRIRFRAPERTDIPRFVNWLNDPDVRRGGSHHLPFSSEDEEKWFDQMQSHPQDEHPMVIEVRKNGVVEEWISIGSIGFSTIDWRNRCSEFGIMIGEKDYWNQGYGTEAVEMLLKHGFETLNLNRIFLRVFENNPGAIRAYEKAGFSHEGRLRQAEYQEGQFLDTLIMGILHSEFIGK